MTSSPPTSSPWRLRVHNLRALPEVDWSPSGVCLLAGPNGSGKTTLLRALQFPKFYYQDGRAIALQSLGGASNLRRLGTPDDEPVVFEFVLGDACWRVEIPIEGAGVHPYFGERVSQADEIVLLANRYEATVSFQGKMYDRKDGDGAAIRRFHTKLSPSLLPLFKRLHDVRIHYSYSLDAARRQGVGRDTPNAYLLPTGSNLWAVLRRWQAQEQAPAGYPMALDWVIEEARKAFPDIFADLSFDETTGEPRFRIPGEEQGLQVHLAADGLLVGLMHLTAVGGAPPGAILAFDEMENQLHPHAIRSILAAMRDRAAERNLTIILTTHSPVLMNEFKGLEHQFYVLELGHNKLPVPLDEARDPDWLAHFSLGDLYDREDFAAPVVERES